MKTSKKIASIFAAAAMALTMAGCSESGASGSSGTDGAGNSGSSGSSGSSVSTGSSSSNVNSENKVYSIGVCQLMEHEALGAATKGFSDKLIELLGADNVKINVQTAQGEQTNCTTIVNNFISSDVDLILANATTPLTTAASATNTIPIVGTSITDYATALSIKSGWTGKSGRNITGTSDLAPIDQQEDLLVEMFPDVKKVGILYCSSEPNSQYQANLFEEALKADNIEYKEFTAADSNEISVVTQAAIAECDVLYIPTDNTFADHTETVKNIVLPAKKPVIAGEEGICRGCGVATLSISYYDIGAIAGEMAYDILANGKNPGDIEIGYAPEVTKKYNKEICDALGIAAPEGYEAV